MADIFDLVRIASGKTAFLNANQERVLIKNAQNGDLKSSEQLFCANSRYILKQSINYAEKYGLPLEDVFSAAIEGYLKAIEKFDLNKENRLITLATWWIQCAIQDELYRSHVIKIPRNKINLLNAENTEGCENLSTANLFNACGDIASLDETFRNEEDSGSLYDTISSHSSDPEEILEIDALHKVIETILKANLNEREIYVIKMSFGFIDGEQHSLSEIGALLGCSKQRADQIKKAALIKLRHPNVSYRLKDFVA